MKLFQTWHYGHNTCTRYDEALTTEDFTYSQFFTRFPVSPDTRIFTRSTHERGKVVSPTHRPPLPPKRYFSVGPRAIVQQEWLSHWRVPMSPSGIKPATLPLVAQCLNILPRVTNWEMSAERSTSSAFALLLSLDSKSVTIFAETRRIRVPEKCLPTCYTTHTKLSPYLCNRYEIDHAHLLCTDYERFLRPHTLLTTQSHLYTNNCGIS
jgi:hypothetical protein